MSKTIRILVVDDHPIVRDGLVAVLGTQPDLRVIGQAGTGPEAILLFRRLKPDVLLLDLEMPEMDGVHVLQEIRKEHQELRAIVFTAFDTDERILSAVRAGAQGYLLKGVPRAELFNAIRVVHGGGSLLQPVVASKLLRQMSTPETEDSLPEPLTNREHEVLTALARGLQNKEIAKELDITERTVKFHVSQIMRKLDANNRTEVVAVAAQLGLVDL